MRHYLFMPNAASTMKLQGLLRSQGIESTIAPTPREADHCCGVCILYVNEADRPRIAEIAEEADISVDAFCDMEDDFRPDRHRFL